MPFLVLRMILRLLIGLVGYKATDSRDPPLLHYFEAKEKNFGGNMYIGIPLQECKRESIPSGAINSSVASAGNICPKLLLRPANKNCYLETLLKTMLAALVPPKLGFTWTSSPGASARAISWFRLYNSVDLGRV